jgi:Txe/YoeB family toxin of Txe-Axe toxin-antitoxin module
MTYETGEHLTTSRISRLLRPLRVRCQKLALYSPEATTQRCKGSVLIMYGNSSRQANVDLPGKLDNPPLAIIPPPEKLSGLLKLHRSARENLELSRRIYDVRDAFRNILQAAVYSTSSSRRRSSVHYTLQHREGRIRSLAAMCAGTVGEHLEAQVQLLVEEREGTDINDDDKQELLDSLYEAVRPQYRK